MFSRILNSLISYCISDEKKTSLIGIFGYFDSLVNMSLTSSNNQFSEFRISNIYNKIFVLIFLMILRTHFEASLRFRKNYKRLHDFNIKIAECLALLLIKQINKISL